MNTKFKTKIQKKFILISFIVLMLSLAIAEYMLSFMMGNASIMGIYQSGSKDKRCFALQPNATLTYTGYLKKIPESNIIINEQGYRGPVYTDHKPPHTFRVSLLGGSIAFGLGVNEQQTLSHYLEETLKKMVPETQKIEVLNFAIPGLNLEDIVIQYQHFASRWEADLVLYVASVNNLQDSICVKFDFFKQLDNPERNFLKRLNLAKLMLIFKLKIHTYFSEKNIIGNKVNGPQIDTELGKMTNLTQGKKSKFAFVFLGLEIEKMLNPILQKHQIESLDLNHLRIKKNMIPNEAHLNGGGNKIAAEAIAKFIMGMKFDHFIQLNKLPFYDLKAGHN